MDFSDRFGAFFRTEQMILGQVIYTINDLERRQIGEHLQALISLLHVFRSKSHK